MLAAEQPALAVSPEEALLESFERYLLGERGLAAGTVHGYMRHAHRFLHGRSQTGGLGSLTAGEVTSAVLRESAAVSVSATQNFVAGLKSFLRFCLVNGLVEVDLSEAALPTTGRRRSSLPRGIDSADAKALLASCDRRTALGRRDYALIVTLLRLGLRRAEVAGMRLDDIDWRAGELVVRGKGAREDRLPLPVEVGEAIASYLRRGKAAHRPSGGVPAGQGAVRADRVRHGRLNRAPGVSARRDRGGGVAPAASHHGLRDGRSRRPARRDRPGAPTSKLAEHRCVRPGGSRSAAAAGRAVARGSGR